jgi:hypothetical protein
MRTGSTIMSISAAVLMLACLCLLHADLARAETQKSSRSDSLLVQKGDSARLSATQLIPVDKLDAQGRAKVHNVLSNVTIFRRMPVRVVDCDPDLYLFLVRHPDVVVDIWSALKISQLQLKQTGKDAFRLKESAGITADLQYLYSSHDLHLIYAEGVYEGGTFGRQVKGAGLFLLKTGYIRETDGRYYVSSRLDSFISVEPSAVELVAKAIQPLLGLTADNNFSQTVAFAGSLSRTTELNYRSVQRLGTQLNNVQPNVRDNFIKLTEQISEKPSAVLLRKLTETKAVARKDDESVRR